MRFVHPRSGQDEAVLLLRRLLENREVFPGFFRGGNGQAGDLLLLYQAAQQPAGFPAGGIDRGDVAAEPPDDARDIDPAAAGMTARRRAPQLTEGRQPVDRCRDVDGRVRGKGYDLDQFASPSDCYRSSH